MIHIYHGMGKGKTSSAVGQSIRMAGHDKKIVFCQFIKNGSSGEIEILKNMKNVTCVYPSDFENIEENKKIFKDALVHIFYNRIDLLVLDEALDAIIGGAFTTGELCILLDRCSDYGIEVIVTGHLKPDKEIINRADYITHFNKIKHPFDKGVKAREGVEY